MSEAEVAVLREKLSKSEEARQKLRHSLVSPGTAAGEPCRAGLLGVNRGRLDSTAVCPHPLEPLRYPKRPPPLALRQPIPAPLPVVPCRACSRSTL